jgi:hypothetical protein
MPDSSHGLLFLSTKKRDVNDEKTQTELDGRKWRMLERLPAFGPEPFFGHTTVPGMNPTMPRRPSARGYPKFFLHTFDNVICKVTPGYEIWRCRLLQVDSLAMLN